MSRLPIRVAIRGVFLDYVVPVAFAVGIAAAAVLAGWLLVSFGSVL